MKMMVYKAILILIAMLTTSVASASTINMTGRIPVICQLQTHWGAFNSTDGNVAQLDIFCNSSNGAKVSAMLVSGDTAGYRISTGIGAIEIMPGETSDIVNYTTAFRGAEMINLVPVSRDPDVQQAVMQFSITAE